MTRPCAIQLTRVLLLLGGPAILTGCLAEPRADAALRAAPGFAAGDSTSTGDSVSTGSGPLCSSVDLAAFDGNPSAALSSCFLAPAKCKDNGNACVTKCLLAAQLKQKCASCVSSYSPCVVNKCKKDCTPSGIVRADKALAIACPICVEKSCAAGLAACTQSN